MGGPTCWGRPSGVFMTIRRYVFRVFWIAVLPYFCWGLILIAGCLIFWMGTHAVVWAMQHREYFQEFP